MIGKIGDDEYFPGRYLIPYVSISSYIDLNVYTPLVFTQSRW